MVDKLIRRLWDSPTFNTWISFIVVPINTVVFFPLLLKIFNVDEIALWFLFSLYISLQVLADFGFYNTFVRVISYAFGGRQKIDEDIEISGVKQNIEPNWTLITRINQTMNGVYVYATFGLFFFLLIMSFTLVKQINQIEGNHINYWIAWGVVIVFSSVNFNKRRYSNFLLGINKVALTRRIQGVFSLFTITSNLIVLLLTKSFLFLIISSQVWFVFSFFYLRYTARRVENGIYSKMSGRYISKDIFSYVWGPAWKGGISSFASTGTIKLSGIMYAQLATSGKLAEYLLALKILEIIKNISMAPFYSKIPLLSKLYGQHNMRKWKAIAKRGMMLSNSILIIGVVGFGIFGSSLFRLISSNLVFPSLSLWYLLGFARYFHRYGAMHTQLYMTSNKVNSHISDILAGIIFVIFSLILYPYIDVYAFGIGMIMGYFGFYIWYALYYSYTIIQEPFLKFELKSTIIPFIFFLFISFISIVWQDMMV